MINNFAVRLRQAADPNVASDVGALWNLCEEAADEIDALTLALDLADRIIRTGCASYRGARLQRTKFGTVKITGPGNFRSDAGSIRSAISEVDIRLIDDELMSDEETG